MSQDYSSMLLNQVTTNALEPSPHATLKEKKDSQLSIVPLVDMSPLQETHTKGKSPSNISEIPLSLDPLPLIGDSKNSQATKQFVIDNDDFKTVKDKNGLIIDKSLFIKEVLDDKSQVKLIIRPRYFGKTFNISMLKYFFDSAEKEPKNLFQELDIWSDKNKSYRQHYRNYPVIFLTLKDIKADNFEDALEIFRIAIGELYEDLWNKYKFERTDEVEQIIKNKANNIKLQFSLKNLIKILKETCKREVILLIDDYDAPLHTAYTKTARSQLDKEKDEEGYKSSYYAKMANFIHGLLCLALKDNACLHSAVLTGNPYFSKEDPFYGLNNLCIYNTLDEGFSSYFGFSKREVFMQLHSVFGLESDNVLLNEVDNWYGGYQIGQQCLFNPWSIANFIEDNRHRKANEKIIFKNYWLNMSDNDLIIRLLKQSDEVTKHEFKALVCNQAIIKKTSEQTVFKDIANEPETLWSFLLLSGYLTTYPYSDNEDRPSSKHWLVVPNQEVYEFYSKCTTMWFKDEFQNMPYKFPGFKRIYKTSRSLENPKIINYRKQLKGSNSLKEQLLYAHELVTKNYIDESVIETCVKNAIGENQLGRTQAAKLLEAESALDWVRKNEQFWPWMIDQLNVALESGGKNIKLAAIAILSLLIDRGAVSLKSLDSVILLQTIKNLSNLEEGTETLIIELRGLEKNSKLEIQGGVLNVLQKWGKQKLKKDEKSPSQSHAIRSGIQQAIAPLQKEIDDFLQQGEGISDGQLLVRTQALYAQQSLIARDKAISKALNDTLQAIQQGLPKESKGLRCFISYAWPTAEHQKKEYWLQPFLRVLHGHLTQAGIKPRLDIIDNLAGGNVMMFTNHIKTDEFAVLICTESLANKHHHPQFRMVQMELNLLQQKYDTDVQITSKPRVLPLLVSGSYISTSLPHHNLYHTVRDWRVQSYVKNLEQLIGWVCYPQGVRESYQEIWQDFYAKYPTLASPMPEEWVKQELELQRHQDERNKLEKEEFYQGLLPQQCQQSTPPDFEVTIVKDAKKNAPLLQPTIVSYKIPRPVEGFIDRTELLQMLTTQFGVPKVNQRKDEKETKTVSVSLNTPKLVLCTGLGGVGKTQLALRYADTSAKPYQHKFWFVADNSETLTLSYRQFAREKSLMDESYIPDKEVIRVVNQWLATQPNWLIIYDNVGRYEEIAPYLPIEGEGDILLTSRRAPTKWPKNIAAIVIDTLSPTEANQLVTSLIRISSSKSDDIAKLAELMGYLPLALAQASAYINRNKISIKRYLEIYQEKAAYLLAQNDMPKGISHEPVFITWDINLAAIEKEEKNSGKQTSAKALLQFCAHLSPQTIPTHLIETWHKATYPNTPEPFEEVQGRLHAYSLIQLDKENQSILVHRLLQQTVRVQFCAAEQVTQLQRSMELLVAAYPQSDVDVSKTRNLIRSRFIPHLESTIAYYQQYKLREDVRLAFALCLLANAYSCLGNMQEQLRLLEHALKILEIHYGPDHWQTATVLVNLANAHGDLGSPQEKRSLLERALKIFGAHYGPDHWQTTTALVNLANAHGDLGNPREKRSLLERALKIFGAHYGPDHWKAANILINLANVHGGLGDIHQQRYLLEQALKIFEDHYGQDHWQTAAVLGNLATVHRAMGDVQKASYLLKRALKIFKVHYGPGDWQMAVALGDLAIAHLDLGETLEAHALLKRSLEILEECYGTNHWQIVTTLLNLAKVHRDLGDITQQCHFLQRALKIQESCYGTDHWQTAATRYDLAGVYRQLKQFQTARVFTEQALTVFTQHYGLDHPTTQRTLKLLSNLYNDLNTPVADLKPTSLNSNIEFYLVYSVEKYRYFSELAKATSSNNTERSPIEVLCLAPFTDSKLTISMSVAWLKQLYQNDRETFHEVSTQLCEEENAILLKIGLAASKKRELRSNKAEIMSNASINSTLSIGHLINHHPLDDKSKEQKRLPAYLTSPPTVSLWKSQSSTSSALEALFIFSSSLLFSSIFYRMRGFLKTRLPYFNRLSSFLQISLLVSAPISFTAWGYLTYLRRQLADSARHIQRFHSVVVQEMQDWGVWKIEDRPYSMSDVTAAELAQHRGISFKISKRSEIIGRLRNELNSFWLLGWLERLQALRRWGVRPSMLWPGSLQSLHHQLDATDAALAVTDDMNHALLYLKKRFYLKARNATKNAIEKLSVRTELRSGIGTLSPDALLSQAFNIAAKVARAQNDYASCNRYYEQAIAHLKNHPDLSKVLIFHIALWGDMAWGNTGEVTPIKRYLDHPELLQSLIDRFSHEQYSLGLTNLSWVLIQVALKANQLGLSASQQAKHLQQAEVLAGQAIALEQQRSCLPHTRNHYETMNEASSNAWLFRGIARMEQAERGVKAEEKSSASAALSSQPHAQYSAALQDFDEGLKLPSGQDHPSLLRRRAMVLEKLGDLEGAYNAYRLAQTEFRYRLANQELLGPHSGWLREIEQKVKTLRSQVHPNKDLELIIDCLIAGDYLQANQLIRALPPLDLWIQAWRAWFDRHYQSDPATQQVVPKARKSFLARLGLYGAPSPYVFMALSAATYRAKYGQGLGSPSGWQKLCISNELLPDSAKSGYLGIAFQHVSTRQIIISHGGPDWTDPEDLEADIILMWWGKKHPQLEDAQRFTQKVMQLMHERAKASATHGIGLRNPADSKDGVPDMQSPTTTYHTGHSLGGALAAYVACTSAPVGNHYAVTFDNPSSYWQISNQLYQDSAQRWYTDRQNFPVTSYLVRPTFINCAGGPHLGRIMRLQVEPSQTQALSSFLPLIFSRRATQWVTDYLKSTPGLPVSAIAQWTEIAKANIACHSLALNLNAVIDSDKPEQQYHRPIDYVLAWPEDLPQWFAFEKAMRESKLSAEALLQDIPPVSVAKGKSGYRLSSSQSSIEPGSEFRESIPLQALESKLASLFKHLLKDGPLTPERFQRLLETNALTNTQQQLAENIDFYVLSCLQLNADHDQLLLKGVLSSWELFTYLRQQVQDVCQKHPELTVAGILYPDLEHLPGLMRPPISPPPAVPDSRTTQAYTSNEASETSHLITPLPSAPVETKESKRSIPSYGAFFSSVEVKRQDHKQTGLGHLPSAKTLLAEVYDLLDQVYPPRDVAHLDARRDYLLRLTDLQRREGNLTAANYMTLEKLQIELQQQQKQFITTVMS